MRCMETAKPAAEPHPDGQGWERIRGQSEHLESVPEASTCAIMEGHQMPALFKKLYSQWGCPTRDKEQIGASWSFSWFLGAL